MGSQALYFWKMRRSDWASPLLVQPSALFSFFFLQSECSECIIKIQKVIPAERSLWNSSHLDSINHGTVMFHDNRMEGSDNLGQIKGGAVKSGNKYCFSQTFSPASDHKSAALCKWTLCFCVQVKPVQFTVQAIVTSSDLQFDQTELNFGYCSVYQSVRSSVLLTNLSLLPQDFGFVSIPEVRYDNLVILVQCYWSEDSVQTRNPAGRLSCCKHGRVPDAVLSGCVAFINPAVPGNIDHKTIGNHFLSFQHYRSPLIHCA